MLDYVSPSSTSDWSTPATISSRCWPPARKGVFTRHQVLVNTSLLLLAGHETTINLLCNGTWPPRHPEQWALFKQDPDAGPASHRECALRPPVKSLQRSHGTSTCGARCCAGRSHPLVHRPPTAIPGVCRSGAVRHPTIESHVAFRSGFTTAWGQPWPAWRAKVFRHGRFPFLAPRTDALAYQPASFRSLKSCRWLELGVMARSVRRVDHQSAWAMPCAKPSPRRCFASTRTGSRKPSTPRATPRRKSWRRRRTVRWPPSSSRTPRRARDCFHSAAGELRDQIGRCTRRVHWPSTRQGRLSGSAVAAYQRAAKARW